MAHHIKPIGKRILVKHVDKNEQMKGGILIPDNARERPQEAEVIELGTSGQFSVSVGDTVILSKYGGTEIKIEDVEYKIVTEDDILARVL